MIPGTVTGVMPSRHRLTLRPTRSDRIVINAHADNETAEHASGEDEATARRFG